MSSSSMSPASSATMSSSDSQRADQIAFHFYTKLFYVVSQARTTNPLPAKLDKWFNLETPDSDLFTKEDREPYKSISSLPPPPLQIQVLLTVPELASNQVLVHLPPDSSRVRIHPTPRFVLLETFVLDFVPGPLADVPLPTIYKHGIPLFRSLFTLLRVLPAWKLHKRLRRRAASLGITLRVRSRNDPDVLSLTNAESKTHTFPPLPHPMGSFTLSTTYLVHPTFQLDELESLLSSRFLSQDQRPFTPTLAKTSAPSSPPRSPPRQPSSLPRSSLGKQSITAATLGTPPPSTRAQILKQSDSSTSSLSPSNSFYTPASAAGQGQDAQPRPRYPFPFKSNTVSSTAFPSSSLGSGSAGHPSSLTDRIAHHERERERVASLPHAPTPDFPISQSPSQSQPQQRTGPIPLHVRQTSLPRPTSLRDSPEDPAISTSASSGTGAGTGTRKRYSSSFGHRYAPTPSPSTSSPSHARPAPIQSYSPPSVSHSPSSPGFPRATLPTPSPSSLSFVRPVPAPLPVRTPPPSTQTPQTLPSSSSSSSPLYPHPHAYPIPQGRSSVGNKAQGRTDDDDISLFVKDIDMRKPLVGRSTSRSGSVEPQPQPQSQPESQPESRQLELELEHTQPGPELELGSPPGGLMLTTEAEVDARLSKMNEAFLRSLQGLGSGSASRSGSGSGWRRERSESQSQNQSQGSRSSGRGRGWVLAARERETSQDMDMGRQRSGSEAWARRPPGMLVRQGSQEVVGRMEMDIYSGGVDLDDLDPSQDLELRDERGEREARGEREDREAREASKSGGGRFIF